MASVTIRSGADLQALRARVENLRPLLNAIGAILVSEAQRSFEEQAWDGTPWPDRYPTQDEPFVNIAALVHGLNEGGAILSRYFDRQPVLMGTRELYDSFASRAAIQVSGDVTVEVGTTVDYAPIQFFGGESSMEVTDSVRDTLAPWLQSAEGAPYRNKLGFLLTADELRTDVVGRQFLGISELAAEAIREAIVDYITGESGELTTVE